MPSIKVKRTTGSVPSSLAYGELGIAANELYFGNISNRPTQLARYSYGDSYYNPGLVAGSDWNDSAANADVDLALRVQSGRMYIPGTRYTVVKIIDNNIQFTFIIKGPWYIARLGIPTTSMEFFNILPELTQVFSYGLSGSDYCTNIQKGIRSEVYGTTDVYAKWNGSSSLTYKTMDVNGSLLIWPFMTPGYYTCLHEDTPITLFDGTRKPIKSIVPGDLLLSYDFTTNAHVPAVCMWNAPTKQDFHSNYYLFSNGHVLKQDIEGSHEVYNVTKGCWTTCGSELEIGDIVWDEDGNECTYLGVDPYVHTLHETNFYDIVVSNNCYYADGILMAHNPTLKMKHLEHEVPNEILDLITRDVLAEKLYFDFTDIEGVDEIIAPWSAEKAIDKEMQDIQKRLADTDYLVIKKLEGIEVDESILMQRAELRRNYNELEKAKAEYHKQYCQARAKYNPLGEDSLLSEFDYKAKWLRESNKRGNDNLKLFKEVFCK